MPKAPTLGDQERVRRQKKASASLPSPPPTPSALTQQNIVTAFTGRPRAVCGECGELHYSPFPLQPVAPPPAAASASPVVYPCVACRNITRFNNTAGRRDSTFMRRCAGCHAVFIHKRSLTKVKWCPRCAEDRKEWKTCTACRKHRWIHRDFSTCYSCFDGPRRGGD